MNSWIKILSTLLFSLSVSANCDFAPHVSKIYSLSGPITIGLRDMGLLKNSKVKGISIFHPVRAEDYSGRILPGGIFLSQGATNEFAGGIVFYDESRELTKVLGSLNSVQAIEVTSRGLTPGRVTAMVIKTLEPVLKGCEEEFAAWKKKTIDLEEKILKNISKDLTVLFFMGEFRNGRPPETLIVNDGVVKWLVEEKKIKTYPSPLAYVNWSAKVMNEFSVSTLKIAIKDPGNKMTKEMKKVDGGVNLVYPGSLIPGVTQLETIEFWLESLGK